MRSFVSTVANHPLVSTFFQRGPGRQLASRFVAGETLVEALDASHRLGMDGFRVALDYLGEGVRTMDDADEAAEVYHQTIAMLPGLGVPTTLSIKPSQFGLDLSLSRCVALVERIAREASTVPTAVRLDMEDSRHTDATLELWRELGRRGVRVGVVLQAALRRSPSDLEEILAGGGSVRLCKGAYVEPPNIAYPLKSDVDRAYETMLERLIIGAGRLPVPAPGGLPTAAIATHDEHIIRRAIDLVHQLNPPVGSYEFQMLYGIRRDLQRSLVERGYPLRVYVPWGPSWYPYLSRRLAERPANLIFVATAILADRRKTHQPFHDPAIRRSLRF
jgi:proline dehydrogenase